MAEECKDVIFYNPDRSSFPTVKQGEIGDGFPDLTHTLDFWPYLNDIDLFCFPDIGHAGLQKHLSEEWGKAVWGARSGDRYELNRQLFMRTLKEVGLEVAEYTVCRGWTELKDHLKESEDVYIKISRWRGDMETTHWRNWASDAGWLDWLAVNLGPLKEEMAFLVFPSIEAVLELGGDTYNIDGQWPEIMLNGLEHKDTTYFSAVTRRSDMPEPIRDVLTAFAPLLKAAQYRNQWSMELRGNKFTDATCRGGMPSSASQQMLWKNFPEIVWHGANGVLLEPKPAAGFSIECMVTSKTAKDGWDTVELPKQLERWARFSHCIMVEGRYVFPPDEFHGGDLGWLVAIGDTPRETLDRAKALADMLPDGLDANLENLTGLIKGLEESELPFTEMPLPTPAEVIED